MRTLRNYNPVKHGYVWAAKDWAYSTFHRYAARGAYPLDWAAPRETMELALE